MQLNIVQLLAWKPTRQSTIQIILMILPLHGSKDGCTEETRLKELKVNTLLIKHATVKQGAQLRMGIWWALQRGYQGVITIDGNNKDSIEDVPHFIEKLEEGYDFIQGSRFIKG